MNIIQTYKDFRSKGYGRVFLEWLITLIILLTITMLTSGQSILNTLMVAPILGTTTAIVASVGAFWYEEIQLKKMMAKRLDMPTFKPLLNAGFRKRGTIIEGFYEGYYGYAYWTEGNPFGPEGQLSYAVRVVFEFKGNINQTKSLLEQLESQQIILGESYIEGILNSGRSKLPTQKELNSMTVNLIKILVNNGLEPTEELKEPTHT